MLDRKRLATVPVLQLVLQDLLVVPGRKLLVRYKYAILQHRFIHMGARVSHVLSLMKCLRFEHTVQCTRVCVCVPHTQASHTEAQQLLADAESRGIPVYFLFPGPGGCALRPRPGLYAYAACDSVGSALAGACYAPWSAQSLFAALMPCSACCMPIRRGGH